MADLLALATEKMGQTVGSGECIVFVADVVQRAYGVWLWGNAIDAGSQSNITALQNAGVTVQRITNRSQLQRGDIVVLTDGGYGHVAIVEEPSQPILVQQNFNGKRYVTRESVAWEYYGQIFAYGLRLSKGTQIIESKPEEEEEMIKLTVVDGGAKGTVGYLYNGRFIVGGGASFDNLIYQKLKQMESKGKIKPVIDEINTDEYWRLCESYPSFRNSK